MVGRILLIAVGAILEIIGRSRVKAINEKYSYQRSDSMSYSGSSVDSVHVEAITTVHGDSDSDGESVQV